MPAKPMKYDKNTIFLLILLVGIIVFLFNPIGHFQRPIPIAEGWTPPVAVTSSIDSLAGWVTLYKCFDSIIALQPTRDMSAKCFLMRHSVGNSNYWTEVPFPDLPRAYRVVPTAGQSDGTMFFPRSHATNNQLIVNVYFVSMARDGEVKIEADRRWILDKQTFFGETGTNVSLDNPTFGTGSIHGDDIYLPYCLKGDTLTSEGRVFSPFNNGVFHSIDSGETWQMERIMDNEAWDPTVCRIENYYCYFATRWLNNAHELWFARKLVEGGSWSTPASVTKTFAKELGNYTAVADGDTVHVCWMDCRHNKWRFDLSGPAIENDDIYYCHRKDSDSGWSKDVILSKGVLYCYAPTISAEGGKIVVAWAGIQDAGKYHTDYDPNDIFYVASKDGGKTWTKPLKVTDGAKGGMTAGHPEVMLLNGIIHLFYIQGKMNLERVGGMVKLNQPPWPIYYTQRPFPN